MRKSLCRHESYLLKIEIYKISIKYKSKFYGQSDKKKSPFIAMHSMKCVKTSGKIAKAPALWYLVYFSEENDRIESKLNTWLQYLHCKHSSKNYKPLESCAINWTLLKVINDKSLVSHKIIALNRWTLSEEIVSVWYLRCQFWNKCRIFCINAITKYNWVVF